jgi:hypothetical protein
MEFSELRRIGENVLVAFFRAIPGIHPKKLRTFTETSSQDKKCPGQD